MFCGILSNSWPVIALSWAPNIFNSFAIALAVAIWSPVIITVFIPARRQVLTASFTPSLGGSIIPTNPTKFKLFSILSESILLGIWSKSLYATAITLNALSAICKFSLWIFCFSPIEFWHLFNKTSGAPFVMILYLFPILWIVVIIFLLESKGISFILGILWYNSVLFLLFFNPFCTNATSVGSPLTSILPFLYKISQSVHIVESSIANSELFDFTSTTVISFFVNVPVKSWTSLLSFAAFTVVENNNTIALTNKIVTIWIKFDFFILISPLLSYFLLLFIQSLYIILLFLV